MLSLRDSDVPLLAAVAVISPGILDMKRGSRGSDTALTLAASDPFLTVESIQDNLEKYAGKSRPDHPLMSPLYADFDRFPPLLI